MEINILKSIIFYLFASGTILFALLTLFSFRIVYSLVFSILVFFFTSGIFFILGADYNAVIQIAVYCIAIPIIFVFAIMFTADKKDKENYLSFTPRFYFSFLSIGVLVSALFYLLLTSFSLASNSNWILEKQTILINKYQMFKALAEGFYNNYAFAFELLSILLLVIIVGISTLDLKKESVDE